MKTSIHDVAVVGGGVVGAALALALRQAGFRIVLIERGPGVRAWDASHYDLRVYALAPASVRFLDGLGVWPQIAASRACAYEGMRVWEESSAQALRFDAAELRAPELGHIVENDLLTSALWSALEPTVDATDLRRGCDVTGFEAGSVAAQLQLSDGSSVQARLVVAADGAESALRELAGIETVGWAYPHKAVVCHVRAAKPHLHLAYQRFLPDGPLAFLPLADGRCSIVWSTHQADALLTLDEADFREQLGAALQHELGEILDCTPRVSFPLRLLHAREYVRERLALAGDAAHVIHPLAGRGYTLGRPVAPALLRRVLLARAEQRDPGSLRLLKRYQRERQADNLDMLAMTDGLYRAFDLRDPAWDSLRATGIGAVNRLGPIKRYFAQRAIGS